MESSERLDVSTFLEYLEATLDSSIVWNYSEKLMCPFLVDIIELLGKLLVFALSFVVHVIQLDYHRDSGVG